MPIDEFRPQDDTSSATDIEPPARQPWIAVLILAIAVGGIFYAAYIRWGRSPAANLAKSEVSPAPTEEPSSATDATIDEPLPSLDQSDVFLREIVRQLSSRPELASWLTPNDLIRLFVGSVDEASGGASPAKRWRAVAPVEPFVPFGPADAPYADTRTFQRYNRLADIVGSVDAQGAGRLYRRLKPLFQEAYRERGFVDKDFDTALKAVIGAMLATPAHDGPMPLRAHGIGYDWGDPEMQALTPLQRQLLRMGPRNVRLIQQKTREIATAAGLM